MFQFWLLVDQNIFALIVCTNQGKYSYSYTCRTILFEFGQPKLLAAEFSFILFYFRLSLSAVLQIIPE